MSHQDVINLWKEKVYDKASEIDPDSERDWEDIALGFFLANGFSSDEAYEIYRKCVEQDCF